MYTYPIEIKDFEKILKKERFTEEIYKSDEFYGCVLAFSLITPMENIIDHFEICKANTAHNRRTLRGFMKIYYEHKNFITNCITRCLNGSPISKDDLHRIRVSVVWAFDNIESIFDNNEDKIDYEYAILAGMFYNNRFYYSSLINLLSTKALGLEGESKEFSRIIKSCEKERKEILTLSEYIDKHKGNIKEIDDTYIAKVYACWYRMMDFVIGILPEHRSLWINLELD